MTTTPQTNGPTREARIAQLEKEALAIQTAGGDDIDAYDDVPTCLICDAVGHGYPGGGPCPLEDGMSDADAERERAEDAAVGYWRARYE